MHIPPPSLFHLISSCDEISAFRRAVRILTERRFEVFQPRPNARAVALLVPLWAGFYDKGLSSPLLCGLACVVADVVQIDVILVSGSEEFVFDSHMN